MLLIVNRKSPSRQGAAKVIFGHIILNRPEEYIDHRFGNRNQLQCSISWALAGERGPALEGAEHRAHRRRFHFLHLRAEGRGEGAVLPPVTREHVAIHLAEIFVEPALDRSSVYVRRKPERRRTGRSASDTIGISRRLIGI